MNNNFITLLLLILLPPLGVYLLRGLGTDFLINLVLTLIGYIPGIIHGVWLYTR
ncbi:YqaE/Pmp3 family membrane protein [Longibacter salinarum]|uniref:YqaE/Pmp3 family membrane protein n=1 Tax=Longibacter salinarum TaxID=1850348 RepID=A0A2A8CXE5_9BACT|nr:YqaE/Pmp3 family membrane protein [Longibacter salinarum]PEN13058.1 YqaE/Pmp3 family membrane protein [Longibacter salinarum]